MGGLFWDHDGTILELLAGRIINPVVSRTVLVDCFDYRIQTQTFGMSSYQINRFMHGAGRLLRFMYTDRYLHHVVASSMPSYRVWKEKLPTFFELNRKIQVSASM